MRIDMHLQSGNLSVYWLWLFLDVGAVSVVIVIIAICDMPRQEFSLCERVYIHNMYYMKSRVSCSETWLKFRVKFPEGPLIPIQLGDRLKDSKKQAPWRKKKSTVDVMFLQKKTLDEIGERLEHTLQKSLQRLSLGNWRFCVVCTKSNKITEITYTYCEYTHLRIMIIPV